MTGDEEQGEDVKESKSVIKKCAKGHFFQIPN